MPGIAAGWRWLRSRFWLALAFDVLALVLVMVAVHAWQTRSLPYGEPAPRTVLPILGGAAERAALQPGTGIVYFFAPWCGICRASIDNIDALVDAGAVDWATAIALDYADRAAVEEFVRDTGLDSPVLLGTHGDAYDWGVRGYPTYFVIDDSGTIASRSVGYSTRIGMRVRAWLAR